MVSVKSMTGAMAPIFVLVACSGVDTNSDICDNVVFGTYPGCAPSTDTDTGSVTGDGTTDGATVEDLTTSENITGVTFNTTDGTITVADAAFDGDNTFTRTPAYDRSGMFAYTNAAGQRNYYALVAGSASGELIATLVGAEGYNDSGDLFAGFERLAVSERPTQGFADYTGSYAGNLTYIGTGGLTHTTGDALIEVDFLNSSVEGQITNRKAQTINGSFQVPTLPVNTDGTQDLLPIQINRSTLTANGVFSGGTVTTFGGGQVVEEGTYAGVIGGPGATETTGWIDLSGTELEADSNLSTREVGIFTATCDPARPGTVC